MALIALYVVADQMFQEAKEQATGEVTLRFFSETTVPTRLLLVVIYDQYDVFEDRAPGGVALTSARVNPNGVTTTLATFAGDHPTLPSPVFFRHRRAGEPVRREDGRSHYRESRVPVWMQAMHRCEVVITIHDDRVEHEGCNRAD